MNARLPPRVPLLGRTLLLAALLASCGCYPGIVWLPDSSGFVHTFGSGERLSYNRLVHFDLASGKAHVVVTDTGSVTLWPAVSPDSKQLAVAQLLSAREKPMTLQIVVYDLKGQERQRSRPFPWRREPGTDDKREATGVFWSPRGDQLLVHDYGPHPRTGIYDLTADRLVVLEDAQPAPFGGTPFRPDGAGFLLTRPHGGGRLDVVWSDCNCKEQAVVMKPDTVNSDQKRTMLAIPWAFTSSWEGAEAVVACSDVRVRIDTGKGVGWLVKLPDEGAADRKGVRQQYVFPRTGVRLRVLEFNEGNDTFCDLQTIDQGKVIALVERVRQCFLYPAPNGKHVAVGCQEVKQLEREQFLILVVGEDGKVATWANAAK